MRKILSAIVRKLGFRLPSREERDEMSAYLKKNPAASFKDVADKLEEVERGKG